MNIKTVLPMNKNIFSAIINRKLQFSSILPEIKIIEVGPRDGLQNEKKHVPTEVKVELINKLVGAGLKSVEVTSFVSPKWVPQMADNAQVFRQINKSCDVNFPVLVPNLKGYFAAKEVGVKEIAIFASASETFSQKNLNCSVVESLKRFNETAEQASADNVRIRGYVSCVVGCPYEGPISSSSVAKVTESLLNMGCYEISLGDTTGVGTAGSVKKMIQEVLNVTTADKLALHFHDTYGQALSNVLAGLEFGISAVDSSVSGLGGCPYARGASGNLATEDLVYLLYGLGVSTGVDLLKLISAGRFISTYLGKVTDSKVNRALGEKFTEQSQVEKLARCMC